MIVWIVFAILFLLVVLSNFLTVEHFMFNMGTRMDCPTRNQSYDLRGEAAIVERNPFPINNSGFGPLKPSACASRKVEIL